MDAVNQTEQAVSQDWMDVVRLAGDDTRRLLAAIACEQAAALADSFYDGMLRDAGARPFLSLEAVDLQLRPAMQRWIRGLLTDLAPQQVAEQIALQRHVGVVHARINVRVDLVLRGARFLKQAVAEAIDRQAGFEPATRAAANLCAARLIDLAIEIMAAQYVNSHEVAARTDEAYRTQAASMNMSLERERQRTALLDWENRMLRELTEAQADTVLPRLGESAFGLWAGHKAPSIFRQDAELQALTALMANIDDSLLPLCQREMQWPGPELKRLLRMLKNDASQVRYLIDSLFDHFVDLEAGRDALTQLLNRRFLPAVLRREIELCRRTGKSFAILLVDVDHFKNINDSQGHDAGDRVLQHLAQVLLNTVRSGDSVFRYGGEEFLVVCVELDAAQAMVVAEKIRLAVESEEFLLADGARLHATVSIGLALYDRHPDYQRLIDQADQSLYRAKSDGRNRWMLAR